MARTNPATPKQLLTPAGLHILLSLAAEDRHGYGIKEDVEQRTDGKLSLGPATLYEAIHRMVHAGWLAETNSTAAGEGRGNRRKYYRLTAEGRRQMEGELTRLDDIVTFARSNRLMPEPRTN